MAKLIFGMNQSLDGYVDYMEFGPDPVLFRHFIDQTRGLAGSLYGRRLYEIMRYWDDDHPDSSPAEQEFGEAWRANPKWVVSRTLETVGPNATLIRDDLEASVRKLKAEVDGEIEVGGPVLAASLGELELIDEYRVYLHPVVLGHGAPLFAGFRPKLRLVGTERIGGQVLLTFVPD